MKSLPADPRKHHSVHHSFPLLFAHDRQHLFERRGRGAKYPAIRIAEVKIM